MASLRFVFVGLIGAIAPFGQASMLRDTRITASSWKASIIRMRSVISSSPRRPFSCCGSTSMYARKTSSPCQTSAAAADSR
jgi:hypothetical protein